MSSFLFQNSIMPIIPYLTDNRENIDSIYAHGKDADISYVLPGTLYLRGKTREVFFQFIKEEFPDLYVPLRKLYITGGAPKEYKDNLYLMVNEIKAKYYLSGNYMDVISEKLKQEKFEQLSLF